MKTHPMRMYPMKMYKPFSVLLSAVVFLALASLSRADDSPATQPSDDAAPLPIKLPKPRFEGTPKNLPSNVKIDKSEYGKHRPPFMVPKGATNVALNKPVTSSDNNPIIGSLDQITDGDKEGTDGSWVELSSGSQWVQVDLGAETEIYAVVFWHRHDDVRIYHDVIVQVSDDPAFAKGVTTLFNNDADNATKLGAGKDFEYIETNEGKLVDGKKTKARYVRIYTNGSTADEQNHFTEVEVYGSPVK